MRSMSLVALPALLLGGCAGQTQDFPSLAPRPIETRSDAPPATPPAQAPAADADLAARLTALGDRTRAGDTAFADALAGATKAADDARGAGVGDERWIIAQQRLSALESARAAVTEVLAELDALYVTGLDAVGRGESTGGIDEIKAARAAAERSAADQQVQIDSIRTRLSR